MPLSWSQKLFLRLNSQVGKWPWLDKLMYFCGFWLIWVLAVSLFLFLVLEALENPAQVWAHVKMGLAAAVISFAIGYVIALFFPHQRPEKELPHVKKLFTTFGTWKSFPSDHTLGVTLFALVATSLGGPVFMPPLFWIGALLVALGRIYGGVHYPRDIVGGLVLAGVVFVVVLLSQ